MMFANGDSHTFGTGLREGDHTFSQIVADHFNFNLTNYAIEGASNSRILRTCIDAIEQINPSFMLVGWTTWEREEWLIENEYYNINASGLDQLPTKEAQQRYKKWVAGLSDDHMVMQSREWYGRIFQFHNELKNRNIPHLFFNAFHPFMLHYTQPREDWDGCFVMPDNKESGTYYLHCNKNHGCEPVDDYYHLDASAHKIWADVLIKHIEEHDIIR